MDVEIEFERVLVESRNKTLNLASEHATRTGKYPVCEEPLYEFDVVDDMPEQDYWYYDDTSGKKLLDALVQSARQEELGFVDRIGLWEVMDRPRDKRVIGTRWVDTNKGDEAHYNVRSRLVAQETKRKGTIEQFFAGTPPLSALKVLLSLATTSRLPEIDPVRKARGRVLLQFFDVKKAHFWAQAERDLYVELPEDYKMLHDIASDKVGKLRRSMYGMRDAAQLWEKTVAKELTTLGFIRGWSNGCLFYHPVRDLRTSTHGDNFSSLGARQDS